MLISIVRFHFKYVPTKSTGTLILTAPLLMEPTAALLLSVIPVYRCRTRRNKDYVKNTQNRTWPVCVLHTKPFFLPIDIQNNQCPYRSNPREIQAL